MLKQIENTTNVINIMKNFLKSMSQELKIREFPKICVSSQNISK